MRQVVPKTLAVLGATGATGRHVVTAALARGHDVVALVRRSGALAPADRLREVVWPDVADHAALTEALSGVDLVISALGGAKRGPTTVCTDAARTLVPAMTAAGVSRLVAVSAHGVLESRDRSLYSRAVWSRVSERMRDKETMEPVIVDSPLAWTIVRPPALTNAPATGRYQVGEDLPIRLWHSLGRAELAGFCVREADDPRFVHGYPRVRG